MIDQNSTGAATGTILSVISATVSIADIQPSVTLMAGVVAIISGLCYIIRRGNGILMRILKLLV